MGPISITLSTIITIPTSTTATISTSTYSLPPLSSFTSLYSFTLFKYPLPQSITSLSLSLSLIFLALMETALGLQSGVGMLPGKESKSNLSNKVDDDNNNNNSTDSSSYPAESELELGLSLGGGMMKSSCKASGYGRILTAKDFPSGISRHGHGSSSSACVNAVSKGNGFAAVSGTKRAAADSAVDQDASGSPNGVSQVVGWPPIRTYRMNSLTKEAKPPFTEDDKEMGKIDKFKDTSKQKVQKASDKQNGNAQGNKHLGFVKVNMDGLPIGRKIDLNAHSSYRSLAQTLEDMFFKSTPAINSIRSGTEMELDPKTPKLLDGSSEFVLTYEDKEDDWMLVGDVPWGMFLSTVKRLRIMRTSEANGLGPRSHERHERQRNKPT